MTLFALVDYILGSLLEKPPSFIRIVEIPMKALSKDTFLSLKGINIIFS